MEYKTADYHVHSTISPDAKGTMEEMCNAAMDAGIEEVAFTDHYEFYAGGITGKCLKLYRELGGTVITVGSDAHRPKKGPPAKHQPPEALLNVKDN